MNDDRILRQGLDELMLECSEEQLAQLHTYYERMVEVNKVMNLTAITEYEEVCVKHWLDSLCLVKALLPKELNKPLCVIDVGTGQFSRTADEGTGSFRCELRPWKSGGTRVETGIPGAV